jgi:hypothetical protein
VHRRIMVEKRLRPPDRATWHTAAFLPYTSPVIAGRSRPARAFPRPLPSRLTP